MPGPRQTGPVAPPAWVASLSLADILAHLRDNHPSPPVHFVLLTQWADVAGMSEFALRFVSLVGGVSAILVEDVMIVVYSWYEG